LKKFLLIMLLIMLLPIHIYAASPMVIGEGSAGGFHYNVIKDGRTFLWEIGHEKHKKTIQEDSENEKSLESFRVSVNQAESHRFTLILSAGYVVIVGVTTLIFYKKRRHIPLSAGIIITCLAGGALYYAVTSFTGMQAALWDAGYYYGGLLVE
jgi:hypothetical protein